VGVYLDREAMEILDRVRARLAKELGVPERSVSRSLAVKYIYKLSKVKLESSS